MSTLKFINVNKIYPNGVHAVCDFNMEVEDKEFIVFVGPSGCGKSTTLRMLAGLEEITSGEIYIDDTLVNHIPPKDRNIAMVFQNYALYPHMTVYENMAAALKMRKVMMPAFDKDGKRILIPDEKAINELEAQISLLEDQKQIDELKKKIADLQNNPTIEAFELRRYTKKEIAERIQTAANILGLEAYLQRKPNALSGGQKQRVALGRSIVRTPKVFLMDEPLSNLDAKLRVQMRSEIIRIHKRVNATTVYVTHDQTEAMTMANRIVIMKDGYIQQIGTPAEVYNHPENIFVAGFIGNPPMNFLPGIFDGKKLMIDDEVPIPLTQEQKKILENFKGKEVVLGIRPEDIHINVEGAKAKLTCDLSELLGHELIVYGDIGKQRVIIKTSAKNNILAGDTVKYLFDASAMHFFDPNSTAVIRAGDVPSDPIEQEEVLMEETKKPNLFKKIFTRKKKS